MAGNCPPLLSRHACSQLGMKIDCDIHSFSSHSMKVKQFGMSGARNGHYFLPIFQFEGSWYNLPEDFSVPHWREVVIVQPHEAIMLKDQRKETFEVTNLAPHSSDPHVGSSFKNDSSSGASISGAGICSGGGSSLSPVRGVWSPRSRVPKAGSDRAGGRDASRCGRVLANQEDFEGSTSTAEGQLAP